MSDTQNPSQLAIATSQVLVSRGQSGWCGNINLRVVEWQERPFPGESQGEESYVNKSKALWVLKMSILIGDS